jgi:hypothetical protein
MANDRIGKIGVTSKDELKTKPPRPALTANFLYRSRLLPPPEPGPRHRVVRSTARPMAQPGATLALCLRFALVSQIAFEHNGIRALPKTSGI